MKQLLIVKSTSALNGGATAPTDLSSMTKGSIGFFELDDYATWLAAAASKNFAIALGGGDKSNAFLIPEVDYSSLTVVKTLPQTGAAKVVTFTMPAPVKGKDYTVIIVKKGCVFNERTNWTSNITATSTTAATEAANLVKAINNNSEMHGVVASSSSTTVTLTGTLANDFEVRLADELASTKVTTATPFTQSTGQAADIKELALACAAGKGFNDLYENASEMYPGFPENVEDTPYVVYTLRFKVGRSASKQRDEQVYQIVHIAVPSTTATNTASTGLIAKIDAVLGIGTVETPATKDGD